MDIQALKNKVLQLAIEGKLVEQRSEEGTGLDLFNQIQEEKQKLIAEGKIKKEKAVYAVSICHKISHQDCHDLSSKIA